MILMSMYVIENIHFCVEGKRGVGSDEIDLPGWFSPQNGHLYIEFFLGKFSIDCLLCAPNG